MNRIIFGLLTVLSFSFTSIASAEMDVTPAASAETGKIVVYRDKSKSSISFKVYADSEQLGRVKEGRAITADLAAGTYVLLSNLRGSEPLTVTIKAGQTLYIDSNLVEERSGKYHTAFAIVTETVAVNSVPAISDVI